MVSKPGRYICPVGLLTQSRLSILSSLVQKVSAALPLQLQSKEITLLSFVKICVPILLGRKTPLQQRICLISHLPLKLSHQPLLDLSINLFIESVLRLCYHKE